MDDASPSSVAIVGAGAAGLATAIFAARANPRLRITLLDGAPRIGAKILVSGGGRCNVTNARVTADDFWGGSRNTIRRVLAALPVPQTVAFFGELGVPLYEDYDGKLFPESDSAKSVLSALLREIARLGVELRTGQRVHAIRRATHAFELETAGGVIRADKVVLSTGGRSLPKTGSDGVGYGLAAALGHSLVPQTPGLAPLLLDGEFHAGLAGVSHEAALTLRVEGERPQHLRGSLLWTHFGLSGPLPMNASRIWHRARLERCEPRVAINFLPGQTAESADADLRAAVGENPRMTLRAALSRRLPQRVVDALAVNLRLPGATALSHLSRDDRRRVSLGLTDWPLAIRDSRGYGFAEVTAGGVPLGEIVPASLESRVCPGLYLVGEILDCDGRIGGFNFQWAWSGGFVAGRALARA